MVNNNVPEYLHTLVPPSVHQVSQRNLRSQRNIHIPRSRTNLYKDSFIPKTSKDWNSLPESARIVQSLGEFRRFFGQRQNYCTKLLLFRTKEISSYPHASTIKLQLSGFRPPEQLYIWKMQTVYFATSLKQQNTTFSIATTMIISDYKPFTLWVLQ